MSTIAGYFSSSGVPSSQTNSKLISHVQNSGAYHVQFSAPFSSVPAVVVSPQTDNLGTGYVVATSLGDVTETGFWVYFQNLSSPAQNRDAAFSFVAMACN